MIQQFRISARVISAAFVAGMVVATPAFADDNSLELGKNFVPLQDAALETVGAGSSSRRTTDEEIDRAADSGNGQVGGVSPEISGKVTEVPSQFKMMSIQNSTSTSSPPPSATTGGTTTTTNSGPTIFGMPVSNMFSR